MTERTWKVSIPQTFTIEHLESIADGLEEGEIEPGAFLIDGLDIHQVPPELLARLRPVLGRVSASVRT